MKGFRNIGNTCYLNSGLQLLVQNKELCKLILKYSQHSEKLKKIADFIIEYYNENSSDCIVPNEIKKIVEDKQELFVGYAQQDSTEFIIYLLDIIDEEIKGIDKSSNGIEPIFGIDFNVRIKCKLKECLKIYNRKEKNNFLLLDIDSKCSSLDDAYRIFKSGEKLESDDKYFCENCQAKRIASKRTNVNEWPQYLFIWLKRFRQNGRHITKNSQELEIPIDWRHDMKLQGAVIHYGSLNGGHYVYVGENNGKWFLFNDSSVTEIKSESELSSLISKAYWLCYKNTNKA